MRRGSPAVAGALGACAALVVDGVDAVLLACWHAVTTINAATRATARHGLLAGADGTGGPRDVNRTEPEVGTDTASAAEAAPALDSGLYLVATPIGNLADLSERARMVLAAADRVVCEDTRVTGKLLHHLGLDKPLVAYHEHNAEKRRPGLLAELARGAVLALVSDAGTPLVSDPGYKLVRAARDAGIAVHPIPGPSAVLAALTASGLPTDRFFFQGFLPTKAGARERVIAELAPLKASLVLFESAGRAGETLAALADGLGDREAVLARELTKRFETFRRGALTELAARCREQPPKGEVVLVVAGAADATSAMDDGAVDAALAEELAAHGPSEAAKRVARRSGRPRRVLYARALELQRG
jgi:16S rRNA (cytidine1402-2'-O)-methyltransferase